MTFRWKDYKRDHHLRTLTLNAVEFLRRFVLHVLPRGFQRIRHFGFLANRVRQAKLVQCRTLLRQATPVVPPDAERRPKGDEAPAGEPFTVCPVCHQGHMRLVETLHPQRVARDLSMPLPRVDTS